MPAEVETMMYAREKLWHGLGVMVDEAPDSANALRLAGLDWVVEQQPIQTCEGMPIANFKANIRSSDRSVLGVVSDRYKIVQNAEAFAFTDALIGQDVRYETAGSLFNGRKVWLLARLPDTEIVGDKTETYMCFTNTHDGTGAIRVCMTPIRVVCNNTLNFALDGAKRAWSVRHIGDIQSKIHEAQVALQLADEYMSELKQFGDQMANTRITDTQIQEILDDLFPAKDDATDREKSNIKRIKDEFMTCYFAPDIKKFQGTAWGALNAMSDMVGHTAPRRKTANYQANNWDRILNGHVLMDRLVGCVAK